MTDLRARHEQRVGEQERAIVALLADALPPDQHVRARQEAHRLAGSLAVFGFSDASRIALDLAHAWGGPLEERESLVRLAELVVDLRQALRLSPSATAAGPAPTQLDEVDVVVVDDDEMLARLVVAAVEDAGFSTCWFADGAAALEALAGEKASVRGRVLLLDVQLPERDGFDVLSALQQAGCLTEMRVVMLTASSRRADVLRAHQLGAFDYVAKPFGIPLLLRRVQRALDGRVFPRA